MEQEHMNINSCVDDFILENPDISEFYRIHHFGMTYEHGPEHSPATIHIIIREYLGSNIQRRFRSSIDYKRTLLNGIPWGIDGSGDSIEIALANLVDKIKMNIQSDDVLSNKD